MMKMLKIPEHRRQSIATDIFNEDRKRIIRPESNTNQNDLSKFINESDEDEEGPLTESELDEMIENFKKFYFELIHEGRRENIDELIDILCIWRESGQISQADYMKTANKIKNYVC